MTFSGHLATTAIILVVIPNPVAAIMLSLVFHLVMDAVPHAEWRWPVQDSMPAPVIAVDVALTALLIWLMFTRLEAAPAVIAAAALAGILPDLTDPLARRHWPKVRQLHGNLHSWPLPHVGEVDWSRTVTGKTPIWAKVTIQALLVIGTCLFLAYR